MVMAGPPTSTDPDWGDPSWSPEQQEQAQVLAAQDEYREARRNARNRKTLFVLVPVIAAVAIAIILMAVFGVFSRSDGEDKIPQNVATSEQVEEARKQAETRTISLEATVVAGDQKLQSDLSALEQGSTDIRQDLTELKTGQSRTDATLARIESGVTNNTIGQVDVINRLQRIEDALVAEGGLKGIAAKIGVDVNTLVEAFERRFLDLEGGQDNIVTALIEGKMNLSTFAIAMGVEINPTPVPAPTATPTPMPTPTPIPLRFTFVITNGEQNGGIPELVVVKITPGTESPGCPNKSLDIGDGLCAMTRETLGAWAQEMDPEFKNLPSPGVPVEVK
jgi:hypothetical protein